MSYEQFLLVSPRLHTFRHTYRGTALHLSPGVRGRAFRIAPCTPISLVRNQEAISGSRSSITGPGREEIPPPSVTSCFPLQRLIAYCRSGETRGSRLQSQRWNRPALCSNTMQPTARSRDPLPEAVSRVSFSAIVSPLATSRRTHRPTRCAVPGSVRLREAQHLNLHLIGWSLAPRPGVHPSTSIGP